MGMGFHAAIQDVGYWNYFSIGDLYRAFLIGKEMIIDSEDDSKKQFSFYLKLTNDSNNLNNLNINICL